MSFWDVDDAVRNMVRRGTLTSVDDGGSQQTIKARGIGSETFEDCYRPQGHGVSSVPPEGSEGVLLALGGRTDRTLMLGFEHKDSRPTGQKPGWTTLYDDKGNVVSMVGKDGIKVKSGTDHVSIEVPDGKRVYLDGDGKKGTYERVMTASGPSRNTWARVG